MEPVVRCKCSGTQKEEQCAVGTQEEGVELGGTEEENCGTGAPSRTQAKERSYRGQTGSLTKS